MTDGFDHPVEFDFRFEAIPFKHGHRKLLHLQLCLGKLSVTYCLERDDLAHPRFGETELERKALVLHALVSVVHFGGDGQRHKFG